jgi:CO/xanthine dehydrogenase Mo-binding subunit
LNNNLADYLIPVNADVPDIDIIMVPEKDDLVNPLGVKGIGEIGVTGMNAAVANAVFHVAGNGFVTCRSRWRPCCNTSHRSPRPIQG